MSNGDTKVVWSVVIGALTLTVLLGTFVTSNMLGRMDADRAKAREEHAAQEKRIDEVNRLAEKRLDASQTAQGRIEEQQTARIRKLEVMGASVQTDIQSLRRNVADAATRLADRINNTEKAIDQISEILKEQLIPPPKFESDSNRGPR